MSFGGGTTQYILEYIVKVTNQGGAATSGPLNQLNASTQQVTQSTTQLTASQEKLRSAHERVTQAGLGVSKAAKGMAFGFIGIATAGAEAVGMLSMYQQTQTAVTEAQAAQSEALKTGGKNTKEYKDATNELTKAQRWQRMTQRNLMLSLFDLIPFIVLSVNGILKLRTALKMAKEAKEAENALKALGTSSKALAASNTAAQVSQLGLGKATTASVAPITKFKTAQMAANVATTASVGGFKNQSIALGTATTASNAMATSTSRLSKAMRVLSIAMKIAIPLVILEIASQAFQNNWGGFADKVNALGVAFGNAVPAAKGFLDVIGKVGKTIVALFTGNFEDIQSIWSNTQKQLGDTGPTEKQQKAQDELAKAFLESAQAGSELATEFQDMDKKAKKTFLFEHGIKGGASNRFKDVMKGFDKLKTTLSSFGDDLKLINLDEKLGNLFDLPKSFYKKVAFTFEDRFRDLGKELNDKGLTALADELEKAGKGKQTITQAVINAVKLDPTLMSKLQVIDPEAYAEFKKLMDQAGVKFQETAVTSMEAVDWKAIMAIPGNAMTSQNYSVSGKNSQGHNIYRSKDPSTHASKSGPFANLITQFQTGMTEFTKTIKGANWVEAGNALRTGIDSVFNTTNLIQTGMWMRLYIVDPAVGVLSGMGALISQAAKPWVDEFMKSPLGFITGGSKAVTNAGLDFLAGLLGFTSRADMDTGIYNFFQNLQIIIRSNMTTLMEGLDPDTKQFKKEGGIPGKDSIGSLVITQWLKSFTNSATWEEAIGKVFTPQFWSGVFQRIQSLFNSANPTIVKQTQGETRSVAVITIQNWLMDFTGSVSWEQALNTIFTKDFWDGIFQRIQQKFDEANAPTILPDTKDKGSIFQQVAMPWITQEYAKLIEWAQKDPTIKSIGMFIKNPIGSIINLINNGIITIEKMSSVTIKAVKGESTGSIFEQFIPPIITQEYAKLIEWAKKDPTVQSITAFLKNPVGAIMNLINNGVITLAKAITTTTKTPTVIKGSVAGNVWTNQILPTIKGIWTDIYNKAKADPTVQLIANFFKDPLAGLKSLFPSLFQTVSADKGDGKTPSGSGVVPVQLVIDIVFGSEEVKKQFNELSTFISKANTAIANSWSLTMAVIAQNARDAATGIAQEFSKGGKKVNKIFSAMSTHWNQMAFNIARAASTSANKVAANFSSGAKKVRTTMSGISTHWNNMCNNMIKAAKNAASQINSAIQGIKDKVVHVTVERGGALAKGGLMSFAQGGMISAARGRLLTTSGPQVYTIGDNPGGKESVWAIPHNNPFPTMNKIDAFYGRGSRSGSSGDTTLNQNVVLHISGNDIINELKLNKKMRMTIGQDMDRFG